MLPPGLSAQTDPNSIPTTSPIKHVIVIIGENRSFDHVYATYKPKNGEKVLNLLSEGIVKANGNRGANYSLSAQFSAVDTNGEFSVSPQGKSVYGNIPAPISNGPQSASDTSPAPFKTKKVAKLAEPDLPKGDYDILTTGATGITPGGVDTRIANVNNLGEGVFQLTPSEKYDDYASSPVHRFYQMWQQLDCSADFSTKANPSGCQADLFPWVETTIGAGSNGITQPAGFNDATTFEGSTAMAFYNVQKGDAPLMVRG
jgi:phospholipase C